MVTDGAALLGITIRDVAREAGVSTATVSRALRGLPNVDPVTREHVRRVADRLDYVISPAASRLASGRAGSIAVITPFLGRWYFSKVLSGVERVLQRSDLDLLLYSTGDPSEQHGSAASPAAPLSRRRLVIGLPADSPDCTSCSNWDAGDADRRAQRGRLERVDRRRRGRPDGQPAPDQPRPRADRADFRSAAADALLPRERPPGGLPAGARSLRPQRRDVVAGARVLHHRGWRVRDDGSTSPADAADGRLRDVGRNGLRCSSGAARARHPPGHDVAIIGFDGHEMCDMLDLTTVTQPAEELGSAAARCLLDLLDDPARAPEVLRLPTQFCVRGSTTLHRTVV